MIRLWPAGESADPARTVVAGHGCVAPGLPADRDTLTGTEVLAASAAGVLIALDTSRRAPAISGGPAARALLAGHPRAVVGSADATGRLHMDSPARGPRG